MRNLWPVRSSAVTAAGLACAWLAYSAARQDARWLGEHANKKGHYYEGLLDQPNAKRAYEVLGFFAYGTPERPRLDPDPAPNSALQAWFYVPRQDGPNASSVVTIRAKQIASRTNYLLESMPEGIPAQSNAWTSFFWKTGPFISRYHINPNNLAVLAQLKTNDSAEDEILPVVFSLDCKNEQITHYDLMLKVQRYSLADLTYELRRSAGGNPSAAQTCYFTVAQGCGAQPPKEKTPIEVGTVLELPLVVEFPAGWVSLHIFGHYQDSSEGLDLTYRFFHQPNFQCAR